MGLHTDYLGSVRIVPVLNDEEIELLRRVNATRHCGDTDDPLELSSHPVDNEARGDLELHNAVRPGRPGLWCPWTTCPDGCCMQWDRAEKPYQPEQWLVHLIDTYLRPGAALAQDPRARARGLTFDHVLDGLLVGERAETAELFAVEVRRNVVRRRVLLPALPGVDSCGYRGAEEERRLRRDRLLARRHRFASAVQQDLERAACS